MEFLQPTTIKPIKSRESLVEMCNQYEEEEEKRIIYKIRDLDIRIGSFISQNILSGDKLNKLRQQRIELANQHSRLMTLQNIHSPTIHPFGGLFI